LSLTPQKRDTREDIRYRFLETFPRYAKLHLWCRVIIPKPVWAVGFALEQTLRDATLTVFSYVDFKVASAYKILLEFFNVC
jgi:hypothetical protein